jgi:RNA polymerase sigma-70 factor (ECF subfamily)
MALRIALNFDQSPLSERKPLPSGLAPDSDEALVWQARNGDFRAFERLFERHRDLVYRFAYQMAPRRDDAEDIVQEAFIKAYQNLARYRDEAKFTTWLLRITANLGTDRARMSTRRQSLEQRESAGALSWMTVGNGVEDPIDKMEMESRRALLREAIASLPDHHRNAIIFRDIQEMEYDDIAAFFKCSVGGAKLRVLRARRALRDRLTPLLGDQ